MPIFNPRPNNQFKTPPTASTIWDTFRNGLDTLLASSEIRADELAQMDNLYLTGKGIPTKRGGTADYFLTAASVATASQKVRGLKMAKFASGASGTLELLALSDAGFLVKMNGASYTIINGYSYVSGYDAQLTQAFNRIYIANGQDALTRYNGVSISSFVAISMPTQVTATNVSGISGTFTYSWRVSAENEVGETLASDSVLLGNLPKDLTSTTVRVAWTTASPTSNVVRYNIYGRDAGYETLLATVNPSSLTYLDAGKDIPNPIVLPRIINETGGPIFRYIISNKDRLVGGYESTAPSRVIWSGGGANNIDRFHWSIGGGYVDISPNDGDEITGLVDAFDAVIIFKRRSVWQLTFSVGTQGIVFPNVSLLTRSVGCIAPKSIRQVENDVLFLSDKGVYSLGRQATYTSELRTNELSARIRPALESMNRDYIATCAATYFDNKYRLAYPSAGSAINDREIWFDRERGAWVGPMTYPAAPNVYEIFIDGGNELHLVWGDSQDNFVTEYSRGNLSDKRTVITTSLLSKKEFFEDPFLFKRITNLYTGFRNIKGSINVDVIIQTTTGLSVTAKSFTITPGITGVGWGADPWGSEPWGNSIGAGSAAAANDLVRWTKLLKTARSIQWSITTSGTNDNYQLLYLKMEHRLLGRGIMPTSEKV